MHIASRKFWIAVVATAALAAAYPAYQIRPATAQSVNTTSATSSDLSGTVTSTNGAEAGVWVIAETTDLPTKFSKTVVTDDRGRYLIPDLPRGNYSVWVRGYGLVDSPKVSVSAAPGRTLDLRATIAPSAAAAAEYYPTIYWYSMLNIPDKKEFGFDDNDAIALHLQRSRNG